MSDKFEEIQIRASELRIGDFIQPTDKRSRGTRIDKIERRACSKRGLHVNDKFCYIPHAIVYISRKIETPEEIPA